MTSETMALLETLDLASKLRVATEPNAYNPMEEFAHKVEKKELVHSKIIADLLCKDGKHGLNRRFLDLFLIKCELQPTSFSHPEVYTEYPLKGGRWNNRRIDILIVDRTTHQAVIIENKLNEAEYQPNQLEDYLAAIKAEGIENPITVCLHRNYISHNPKTDLKVFYPKDISEILDQSIKETKSKSADALNAYSIYLHNLHSSNTIMDNAKKLYEELANNPGQIKAIEALVAAYNNLNFVYHDKFIQAVKKNGRHDADGSKYYNSIVEIDQNNNSKLYKDYGVFVGVSFFTTKVIFYLVSKNMENVAHTKLNLKPERGDGKYWYYVETYDYEGLPDYKEIEARVDRILSEVNSKLSDKK